MCGIGGKFVFGGTPDANLGEQMAASMTHRGPDDVGVYADGSVVLAHRRLSVIDPTAAGRQPMANADGSVRVIFNGEIYNYRELRDSLEYPFRSKTDTEVLLALYEEHGREMLHHLRGMFAFAIWDEPAERLFLARDRLGQKPLFYCQGENEFLFGSTIRAILADDEVRSEPDYRALREYLTYQYVPHPRTGFGGIRRLGPGECMTVTTESQSRQDYWQLSHAHQLDTSANELSNRLRDELREATRLRLRSDVPLGVFLSGGVDSTIITALMSELAAEPIKTYSIGFGAYDEFEYARAVAEKFGTDHHEHTVTPDALEILPELVRHVEMPFGDPSLLPTYYVSKLASNDITVALSGDAGDENFAGYDRYTYDWLTEWAHRVPEPIRRVAANVLATSAEAADFEPLTRASRLFDIANGNAVERYAAYVCHMLGEDAVRVWRGPSESGLSGKNNATSKTTTPAGQISPRTADPDTAAATGRPAEWPNQSSVDGTNGPIPDAAPDRATGCKEASSEDPDHHADGNPTPSPSSTWDELSYLRAAFSQADGPTRLDRVMNVDIRTYLPDDLLVKVDRASMASSMEVRSPFLDHHLVEFASSIPAKYKWRRGTKKWLLKRTFDDSFPAAVRGRKKQGFSVPVDAYFRGELREFAREKLDRLGNRGPFDADGLEATFDAHVTERENNGHHLWDLVVLEQWYETFIDR